MPLLSRDIAPPRGWLYIEPALNNWRPSAHNLPFDMIVAEIQAVRANNPRAGLDPSYAACARALEDYLCALWKNDPRYCAPAGSPAGRARLDAVKPARCASCGKQKQAAA